MSQEETMQVATRWFAALDRGDIQTAMSCLAEDVEWVNLPKVPAVSDIIPWLGTCHGIQEVQASFQTRDAVVTVKEFKPLTLVVQDDQAFGTVHDHAIVKATGLPFDITFATWMQIQDGKIVRWKSYCDPSPIIVAFRGDARTRLLDAVQQDDAATVRQLLKQGTNPDVRDMATGLTALMFAACHGNAPIVRALLDAGADVFTGDTRTGATALHKACQGGSVEVVRMLLDAGAFIDAVTPTMGHTPIMDALWYKWPEVVRLLAERGANLNLSTHYGFSMMEHFQFELKVNTLGKEALLEIDKIFTARQEADKRQIERQEVMGALKDGKPEEALARIQAGGDVNTLYPHVNSFFDGHTPLLVAARDGHTQVVEALLKAGAATNVADWTFKGSPIHKATYNGNPEILKLLLASPGININVQGPINGYTPLHDAIWHGYTECVQLLIAAGARLDLKGHDGKTPLDLAVEVYGEDGAVPTLIRSRQATAALSQAA
jgi:ankyrin repeat protein